jgi:indoleamine 2,3-dioxygenase
MSPHIVSSMQDFPVLHDTKTHDTSLSPFIVSTSRGFLPRSEPLARLPEDFNALESILARMPIKTLDGSPGLLAQGKLGDTVSTELPDLSNVIKKHRDNMVLMTALYRDYSFLASAYLLEPCKRPSPMIDTD